MFLVPVCVCVCMQYSLCNEPLIELSNPGASGSVFYLTKDDEFIIKTVMHKEAEFLQKLLPGYYMVSVRVSELEENWKSNELPRGSVSVNSCFLVQSVFFPFMEGITHTHMVKEILLTRSQIHAQNKTTSLF